MKYIIPLMFLIFPFCTNAEDKPNSIKLWENRASFFWSMDFSNEDRFKENLINYYKKMYKGVALNKLVRWVKKGNIESEYYSSSFSDYKDTKIIKIEKISNSKYVARTMQSSCYNLDYNPPLMETIVKDYKVSNITQQEVTTWLQSEGQGPKAEACLEINWEIHFELNPSQYIVSEKWNTISSTLELEPNNTLKQGASHGTAKQRAAP